jgi:orotidine-5'-phosphate decarboxylase
LARRQRIANIYLDAKYTEDPEQMADTIKNTADLRPEFISVHAASGFDALEQANKNKGSSKLVASTVPSAMSEQDCRELYGHSPAQAVLRLGVLAARAGFDAITSSAHEMPQLLQSPEAQGLIRIATGIRMPGDNSNDQVRTTTPAQAIDAGADYLAVGRDISEAPDPETALTRILDDLR